MGIAAQILAIAESSVPHDQQGISIERLNLKIGKLSAVVPVSLRFCFEIISKDTALEGADLVIEEIPVLVKCKTCNFQWIVTGPSFDCPQCQHDKVNIIKGRELEVVSIEIAD